MPGDQPPSTLVPAVGAQIIELLQQPPAYELLAEAISDRRRVVAYYHGHERVICPHVLGYSNRRAKLLALQCAGTTSSGPLPRSVSSRWRAMFVDEIERPAIVEGAFESADNYRTDHSTLGMELITASVPSRASGPQAGKTSRSR